MTWQEMHIGFDLGLQFLNSNLFNKIEGPGKDFLLNHVINTMINEEIDNNRRREFNLESYSNIRNSASVLSTILKIDTPTKVAGDDIYDYVVLPKVITSVSSGPLTLGKEYKVTTVGTTNLSAYGSTNPLVLNDIFTCTFAGTPAWSGGTTLTPTVDDSVYAFISSFSNVDYGQAFGAGPLVEGVKYRVVTGGTIFGLNRFGASSDTVNVNDIFLSSTGGSPAWSDSRVTLVPTKTVTNKLILGQDINNFLVNPYGTTSNSPTSMLIGGNLNVYHSNRFKINSITIIYVRPIKAINSILNIDCELPKSLHGPIVDATIKHVMAYTSHPSYQAVVNESNKNN
jgi:hypothetical protein